MSGFQRHRRATRKRPFIFERLETRTLLAGNDVLTLAACTANTSTFDGGSGDNTLVRAHDSLGATTVTNF